MAKQKGYKVTLIFFWLESVELAKERVKIRVTEGGHNIEPDIIERRYINGLKNLFDIYLPLVHQAMLYNNSKGNPIAIADKRQNQDFQIYDLNSFQQLKNFYDTGRMD